MVYDYANRNNTSPSNKKKALQRVLILTAIPLIAIPLALYLGLPTQQPKNNSAEKKTTVSISPKKNIKRNAIKATSSLDLAFYRLLPEMKVTLQENSGIKFKSLPARTGPPSNYFLQVASSKNKTDANTLKLKLISAHYAALVKPFVTSKGSHWFRVLIGPFARRDTAEDAQYSLEQKNITAVLLEK
jgi:cell division protein FtsN